MADTRTRYTEEEKKELLKKFKEFSKTMSKNQAAQQTGVSKESLYKWGMRIEPKDFPLAVAKRAPTMITIPMEDRVEKKETAPRGKVMVIMGAPTDIKDMFQSALSMMEK